MIQPCSNLSTFSFLNNLPLPFWSAIIASAILTLTLALALVIIIMLMHGRVVVVVLPSCYHCHIVPTSTTSLSSHCAHLYLIIEGHVAMALAIIRKKPSRI